MRPTRLPDSKTLARLLPGQLAPFSSVLFSSSRAVVYRPGETIVTIGGRELAIVIDGLIAGSVRSVDGREAIVRYVRGSGVLGLSSLFHPLGGTYRALDTSTVIHLDPEQISRNAQRDAALAWGLAHVLSDLVVEASTATRTLVFVKVTGRIAAHLLELARSAQPAPGFPVAWVTHQAVADAIGSVREVVSRTLHRLHSEGLIDLGRGKVTIIDAPGLRRYCSESPEG